MYSACRRRGKGGGLLEGDGDGDCDCEEGCRDTDEGSEARIRISRTKQSLPPLYDNESSSGLLSVY